jgi:glucokinase
LSPPAWSRAEPDPAPATSTVGAPGAAGIDVGGSKCLGVVVGPDAEVVREARAPTPRGPQALLRTLGALVGELGPVTRLGVGAPGLVTRDGVLRAAPNLPGVFELPLREDLEARLGCDVVVENDATCAAHAEWTIGSAVGATDMVLVTMGTGIGGGFVLGGELQRGAHGFATEPGHMIVDPHGPRCVCGQRGCWERYASGSGLAALAREAATGGQLRAVVVLAGGDPEAVRGEHVQTAARSGDPEALAVMDRFAWWLALGLANLTNLLDPEVIVLGGGVIASLDLVLHPAQRHLADLLYATEHRVLPRLVPAALGERAGAVGAALLATP